MSLDALFQAIDNTAATIVFGIVLLVVFGTIVLAVLFAGLALRAIWRFLTGRTWNDAILSAERKALRSLRAIPGRRFHGRLSLSRRNGEAQWPVETDRKEATDGN